jgi:hypothetical protein
MLKIISFIAVISFIAGCAQSPQVMGIPASPITTEPNTPFVFKPHYQAKRVGIDQQKIVHHSDFATIVSEEEYVFAPRKELAVSGFDKASVNTVPKPDSIIASVENVGELNQPPAEEPTGSTAENYASAPAKLNINNEPANNAVCTNIACEDGSECGKIMTCGNKTCDSQKQFLYDCNGSECQLTKTAIEYMNSAKFAGMCNEFDDLFQCPTKTRCK